jgi:hypothetical protein
MYKSLLFAKSRPFRKVMAALVAVAAAAPMFAADVVQVFSESSLTPTGAAIRSVTVGGSSIPDLVEDLVKRQGQFAQFGSDPFVFAGLSALGVDHVLLLDVQDNGGPVTVRLRSPLTGLDHTITGANRAEAESNTKDYLKKEGADELAKILKALGKTSPISVTTGNPNSSAALTAQGVFDQYGFIEGRTNAELEETEDGAEPVYEVALRGDIGLIEAKGFKAQSYSLPIAFSIIERERWALRMQLPINYTEIEGAEIFRFGANLALPIMVVGTTKEHKTPWYWQLTPSGGSQATASFDLVAGGLLNNVGLTSALEYNLGTNFHNIRLSMGNQITMIESMELTIGDYSFDPNVSSQIFKNGVKASMPLGRSWLVDLYFIDTRFFGDSTYSDGYETIGASIGYRKGRKGGFYKVGSYANIAKDYTSANFHFGAGWAF